MDNNYTKVTVIRTGLKTKVLNSEVDNLVKSNLMKVGWDEIEQPANEPESNKAILDVKEKKTRKPKA